MRIAVISRYNGQVNRGVESWCLNLCRHLEQLGHACLLIQGGTNVPKDASFRIVTVDSTAHDHSSWSPPASLAAKGIARSYMSAQERDIAQFAVRALPHAIAFRPDIIVPANNFWTVVAAKVARCMNRGMPRIVVTSQSGWDYFMRDDLRLGVDGFVAIQPQVYDNAMRFDRSSAAIQLIPNGVDTVRFAYGPVADVPLPRPVVLVVSALDDYKRVDLAVRAIAQAGMSLLLLGGGPNAQHVDHLAHALLGPERFLHLPKVSFDDIPAYYRAANVFTLPSTAGEAFGIVILEAMAAGLPVVVSDDPVRRWIAGDNGWFVDAQDTESYAEALLSAAKAGRRSLESSYLARFDWAAVARDYELFFEQIKGCSRGLRSDGKAPLHHEVV